MNVRVGRDGRIRPLDGAQGRRRAAELLAEHPGASLREVARGAGVSPATARDVRRRLERGEEPAPVRSGAGDRGENNPRLRGRSRPRRPVTAPPAPAFVLKKLLHDPALRHNDQGRMLLRWLWTNAVGAKDRPRVIAAVPPHCSDLVIQLARQYAQMWLDIAQELDERAQVQDPPEHSSESVQSFSGAMR